MYLSKKGFTLIELMTVITIMATIVMGVAVPYLYYQNKAKLKVANREISQSLYEARNMAINGYESGENNQSIGLYFDSANNKNTIQYFGYSYTATGVEISNIVGSGITLIKEKRLPEGVQIEDIGGKKKMLFFFQAVYGNGSYYSFDGAKSEVTDTQIPLTFSFQGAQIGPLRNTIYYFTETNIIDY